MKEAKIAAFGESDIMLIFKAIGADIYPIDDISHMGEAEEKLRKVVREGYGIIFMTETIAARLDSVIRHYANRITPSIVVVPGLGKRNNYAVNQLRTAIIKAVGADVMAEGVQSKGQEK